MSVLVVNNVPLKTPDGGFTISGSQFSDGMRNANGEMLLTKINRRIIKFDTLTWSGATPEEWGAIKTQINKLTGVAKVWIAETNSFQYLDIYWGDDKAVPARMNDDGSVIQYKTCQCSIIDMGLPFRSGW